jgi:NAD(P)-dependent dehydrogenase (short-subunit alcohol dehydrogenase family)
VRRVAECRGNGNYQGLATYRWNGQDAELVTLNAVPAGGEPDRRLVGSHFEKQRLQQTPFGRIGQPNDSAPIAVFLASDDARWVTGEILAASGGL